MLDRHKTLQEFICERTGLRERADSMDRLSNVVSDRIHALDLRSPEEYEELLRSGHGSSHGEIRELAARLTPGETHFFRDGGQFDLLEKVLLPALIRARSSEKALRIWSAGCATGEEAYSIAIVLDSLLPDRRNWNIEIFGTDINTAALETARAGVYSGWSFRVMDDGRKAECFRQNADQWSLNANIRRAVRFETLDLIHDASPTRKAGLQDIDLILCRNVFIYFEPSSIRKVAQKMVAALRPGGYLMTAHGELQGQEFRQLAILSFPESAIYQKASETASLKQTASAGRSKCSPPAPNAAVTPGLAEPAPATTKAPSPMPTLAELEERARVSANRGRYEEAEELCARALREDPFAVRTYYLLSRIADERKQVELCKELLKKVLYLDPGYVAAYLDLASHYENDKDSRRARKLRVSAIKCLSRPDAATKMELYEPATPAELISSLEAMVHCESQ